MGKLLLAREVWLFLRQNKKLWLLPIVVVMLVIGMLLIFAQGSALAPLFTRSFSDVVAIPSPGGTAMSAHKTDRSRKTVEGMMRRSR